MNEYKAYVIKVFDFGIACKKSSIILVGHD